MGFESCFWLMQANEWKNFKKESLAKKLNFLTQGETTWLAETFCCNSFVCKSSRRTTYIGWELNCMLALISVKKRLKEFDKSKKWATFHYELELKVGKISVCLNKWNNFRFQWSFSLNLQKRLNNGFDLCEGVWLRICDWLNSAVVSQLQLSGYHGDCNYFFT